MHIRLPRRNISTFIFLLLCALPSVCLAAENTPALTVGPSGATLYSRQDQESAPIAKLTSGERLTPLAEAVGQQTWYMVKTLQGLIGWVRAADVVPSDQVKATFKEQYLSTWSARTSTGRTFEGTWTVEPGPSVRAVYGTWTLSDGTGKSILQGTWSAEKFSTGWNGVWRALVDGKKGEYAGSWTAEAGGDRDAPLTELFEAAVKDAIRGIWKAGNYSGSWMIRAGK